MKDRVGQGQCGETADKGRKRDLTFDPRQRCANTEMGTKTETDMLVGIPVDYESVRLVEMLWIAIGGVEHLKYHIALPDLDVT